MDSIDHIRRLTEVLNLRDDWIELLNAIGRPIIVTDYSTGHILAVNHEAEVLFGYTWDDMVGRDMWTFLPEHIKDRAKESSMPLEKSRMSGILLQRKDGDKVSVTIEFRPAVTRLGGYIVATIERM